MYCKFCGKEMPGGSDFCPSCGKKQNEAPKTEEYAKQTAPVNNTRSARSSSSKECCCSDCDCDDCCGNCCCDDCCGNCSCDDCCIHCDCDCCSCMDCDCCPCM